MVLGSLVQGTALSALLPWRLARKAGKQSRGDGASDDGQNGSPDGPHGRASGLEDIVAHRENRAAILKLPGWLDWLDVTQSLECGE
jgi:hypothetical protein